MKQERPYSSFDVDDKLVRELEALEQDDQTDQLNFPSVPTSRPAAANKRMTEVTGSGQG